LISFGFWRSVAYKLLERGYLYYFVAKQELEDQIKGVRLFIYCSVCRKLVNLVEFRHGSVKKHAFACTENIVTVVMENLQIKLFR